MVITKTLALKTLSGLVAVGATVGSVFLLGSNLSSSGNDPEVEKLTVGELLGKVGLECGLSGDEIGEEAKDCTVKTDGSINVKVGKQEEEGVTFSSSGTQKLKLSKEEGYPKKLKFVVDSGDLNLTKKEGGATPTLFTKLEQFETYEIKREGEKFYLSRKTEAKEEKKKVLGLGKCTLPESGDSDCSLTTEEEIKKVKFQGHETGVTVSSGTVDLKISKMKDSDTDFGEDKYRFTFTFPQEVTIDSKKKKANTPYDFKIKKQENSNNLTLENAWTLDSLGKKVGFQSCDESSGCTIAESGASLRVKQVDKHNNDKKQTALSKSTNGGSGKIKVTKDVEGYNQGFKFEISEGSIKLSGSTGDDTIDSLGEYETYEIKEEGNDGWFLVRKTKADDFIKKGLKIESFCSGSFPDASTDAPETCNITDPNKLKEVNFENKTGFKTWPTSKNIQLEINKDTSLPGGFKFIFNSCSGSCSLPGSSSAKTDNSGGLMYKIKKNTKAGTISLEPIPKTDQ